MAEAPRRSARLAGARREEEDPESSGPDVDYSMEVEVFLDTDEEEQSSLSDDDDAEFQISHHFSPLDLLRHRDAPTRPYGPRLPVPQPVLDGDLAAKLNNATAAYGLKDVGAKVSNLGFIMLAWQRT